MSMKRINKYIIEKLHKISSKNINLYNKESLKEQILNEDNLDTIIEYLVIFNLLTNIGNKHMYKSLLLKSKFNNQERYAVYIDLRNSISFIIFNEDGLCHGAGLILKELKRQHQNELRNTLWKLNEYYHYEDEKITNIIKDGIKTWFDTYENK